MDPRARALALYFRQRAAAFSLSADEMDQKGVARAGMALLDAAGIAEAMASHDPRLRALSTTGYFETLPGGEARFRESRTMRTAVQRPISGAAQSGNEIINAVVAEAHAQPRRLD